MENLEQFGSVKIAQNFLNFLILFTIFLEVFLTHSFFFFSSSTILNLQHVTFLLFFFTWKNIYMDMFPSTSIPGDTWNTGIHINKEGKLQCILHFLYLEVLVSTGGSDCAVTAILRKKHSLDKIILNILIILHKTWFLWFFPQTKFCHFYNPNAQQRGSYIPKQ